MSRKEGVEWEEKHSKEEKCGIKTDSVWVTRQETWQTCRVVKKYMGWGGGDRG